jgi:hypothetical protein
MMMISTVCALVLLLCSLIDRQHLCWWGHQGEGLIAAAETSSATGMMSRSEADDAQSRLQSSSSNVEASTSYSEDSITSEALSPRKSRRNPEIKLVCIDMDGNPPDRSYTRHLFSFLVHA